MRIIKSIYLLFLFIITISCNSGDGIEKDPYCEFVDGVYTYDIDLRRTMSYQGVDFNFTYYNGQMQESNSSEARFVHLKGIGRYYDEKIYATNDIEIQYSSLIPLPKVNRLSNSYLNILTTLQAERVIYLMYNGLTYDKAMVESEDEIRQQIQSSEFFSLFKTSDEVDFNAISMNDEFLSVMTKSISDYIDNAVEIAEDKSIVESIWNEFILNYSQTGDMGLVNLEPKAGDEDRFNFYLDLNKSLKATVSQYQMPFSGGIPQVRSNKIYYGVDTNSYVARINNINDLTFRVNTPIYSEFNCNGYFNISADIYPDSLASIDDIRIRVRNMHKYKSDTIYTFPNNSFTDRFSSMIWLKENAKYKVDVLFGKDSLSYKIENKVDTFECHSN